ncbi:MAG: hypothetical protein WCF67_03270 [Chitinophagaceae bacterium]
MNKSRRLRLYFWVFLALNLGYIAWSRNYLEPLHSKDIVQFEVAKTLPVAERIMGEWSQAGKLEKARQSIWVDYIFIVLYSGLLITGVLLLSRSSGHVLLKRMGRFLSMLLPIAAICDIAENIAMTQSLSGKATAFTVTLAYDMAVAKFSIIIIALIFLLICILFWIGNRFTPKYRGLEVGN